MSNLEKVKEMFKVEPEHLIIADQMADEIFKRPSFQHSEMVERIRDRLKKSHHIEIDKI